MEVEEVRRTVREQNIKLAVEIREKDLGNNIPAICECGDSTCRGIALMPLDHFEDFMSRGDRFLIGAAHTVKAAVVDAATGTPLSLSWQ